jgi:hypothetical protein
VLPPLLWGQMAVPMPMPMVNMVAVLLTAGDDCYSGQKQMRQ